MPGLRLPLQMENEEDAFINSPCLLSGSAQGLEYLLLNAVSSFQLSFKAAVRICLMGYVM